MKHTKIVLLQRVAKFGEIGDVIDVKPGFARNYLLPKKIALRATKENLQHFESQRAQIEEKNTQEKAKAFKIAETMENLSITVIRQASEKGQLYGSVTTKDIATVVTQAGFLTSAGNIILTAAVKMVGVFEFSISLHPEVTISALLSVAKSEEEAKVQLAAVVKTSTKNEEVVANDEEKIVVPNEAEIV